MLHLAIRSGVEQPLMRVIGWEITNAEVQIFVFCQESDSLIKGLSLGDRGNETFRAIQILEDFHSGGLRKAKFGRSGHTIYIGSVRKTPNRNQTDATLQQKNDNDEYNV